MTLLSNDLQLVDPTALSDNENTLLCSRLKEFETIRLRFDKDLAIPPNTVAIETEPVPHEKPALTRGQKALDKFMRSLTNNLAFSQRARDVLDFGSPQEHYSDIEESSHVSMVIFTRLIINSAGVCNAREFQRAMNHFGYGHVKKTALSQRISSWHRLEYFSRVPDTRSGWIINLASATALAQKLPDISADEWEVFIRDIPDTLRNQYLLDELKTETL